MPEQELTPEQKAVLAQMEALRRRSGAISMTGDPLTSFIYELLRDHITPGKTERIVQQVVIESGREVVYTNGFLALYAKDLADRLRGTK
jgi:hypothetical protein